MTESYSSPLNKVPELAIVSVIAALDRAVTMNFLIAPVRLPRFLDADVKVITLFNVFKECQCPMSFNLELKMYLNVDL